MKTLYPTPLMKSWHTNKICCGAVSLQAGHKGRLFIFLATALVLLTGLNINSVRAQEFDQIDCAAIAQWTGSLKPGETIPITPKLSISALFKNELTQPLFGKSVHQWDRPQLKALEQRLKSCYREAQKRRDKKSAQQINLTVMALRDASGTMASVDRWIAKAENYVQGIIDHPARRGTTKMIELAQEALKGADVTAYFRSNQASSALRSKIMGLQQAHGYLPENNRRDWIGRLEVLRTVAASKSKTIEKEMAEARAALARVPMTHEGLNSLTRFNRLPVLAKVSYQQAQAFRSEVQKKHWTITNTLRQQTTRKEAAEAAKPVDIQVRLQELLVGKKIKALTLRGLQPGIQREQAVRHVKQTWRFERAATMGLSEKYAPVRQDRAQYNHQRRSGGTLELMTMNDKRVGQITFVELYKNMLIHSSAQVWLTRQFGKPDDIKNYPYWSLFTWKSGSQRLQVKVANQLDVFERGAGFKSKLALAIWNNDYEDHLATKNKQCDKIRKTPSHKISVQDTMWFGQRCPLVDGNHRRAGF